MWLVGVEYTAPTAELLDRIAAKVEAGGAAGVAEGELTLAWPESSGFFKRKAEDPASKETIARVTGFSSELGETFAIVVRLAFRSARPISAEVVATDYDEMMREAGVLRKIADNIAVKVPLTIDGLKACKALTGDGWRDTAARIEGPIVNDLQSAFLDNWIKVTRRALMDKVYFPRIILPLSVAREKSIQAVDRSLAENRLDLTTSRLRIEDRGIRIGAVVWGPRIGIRVGVDKVIVENIPYFGGGGKYMRASVDPDVITTSPRSARSAM